MARVHQLIQQVQIISYMEKMLLSLSCLPSSLQYFIRHQFQGLTRPGQQAHFSTVDLRTLINSQAIPRELGGLVEGLLATDEVNTLEKKFDALANEVNTLDKKMDTLSDKVDQILKALSNNDLTLNTQ